MDTVNGQVTVTKKFYQNDKSSQEQDWVKNQEQDWPNCFPHLDDDSFHYKSTAKQKELDDFLDFLDVDVYSLSDHVDINDIDFPNEDSYQSW